MSNIWGRTVQNLARYTFLTFVAAWVLTERLTKKSLTREQPRQKVSERGKL